MKHLRKALPVLISIILLAILAAYTPLSRVGDALTDLRPIAYAELLLLSLVYYFLRVVRFWYMLRNLNIKVGFCLSALCYLAAQPVSLLPAGELYRPKVLERETGVAMNKSLPTFTMQGLLEGAAMVAVGFIGALALGRFRIATLAGAVVIGLAFAAVYKGYLNPVLRLFNRLPFISIRRKRLQEFSEGNQALLSENVFPVLLALSIANELIGAAIAYVAVSGLGGHISIFLAIAAYIVPVVAGFISFLPGGFGAAEQSSIGVLLLGHTGIAIAVAATLLIRIVIVGSGQVYGVVAILWLRLRGPKNSRPKKKMSARRA